MISAPVRTPKTIASELTATASVKTQGHLALLEWDEPTPAAPAPARNPAGSVRRSALDRCYDGGTLVLFVVTTAAMIATLARF